jgi:hypothetical protein
MVLGGGADVAVLSDDAGSDDVVGTVDDGDDEVGLGEALVLAGVDAGGVEVAALRAGAGAPVSVLVDVLDVPVARVSGRTLR